MPALSLLRLTVLVYLFVTEECNYVFGAHNKINIYLLSNDMAYDTLRLPAAGKYNN